MEIAALNNVVPDGINQLIFKFVGYQTKTAKIINEERKKFLAKHETTYKDFITSLKFHADFKLKCIIRNVDWGRLGLMKSIIQRREELQNKKIK